MDDLSTLLEGAAGTPRTPVDGATIRAGAERRRRRRAALVATVVLVGVAIPVIGLMSGGTEDVRLEQGPADRIHTSTAPAEPVLEQPSYRVEMEVDAAIDGPLAEAVTVTGLSDRDAREGGMTLVYDAAVVVTSTTTLDIALDEVSSGRGVSASISRIAGTELTVDRETAQLQPNSPTVVILQVEAASAPTQDGPPRSVPFTDALTVTLPVRASDGGRADVITVDLTPRQMAAAELGIPEPTDIPDQDLPRPAIGEALPEQLEDGTPVWVVGLDEDVVVVGARSPHTPSGLVGWCGTLPGFIDSPGASIFDSRGLYRFGPAPTGLTPYEIDVNHDSVTVRRRLAPPPRPPESDGPPGPHPPIAGSPLEQGMQCESNADRARAEGLVYDEAREELFREDYTDAVGWGQHDPSGWPVFDGQQDGWFHTDEIEVDDQRWTGDLLIRRQDGRTVDVTTTPGADRMMVPTTAPWPIAALVIDMTSGPDVACPSCAHGAVTYQSGVLVTPTEIIQLEAGDTPPAGPVSLAPELPFNPLSSHIVPLAADATISASRGDLAVIHRARDSHVTEMTRVDAGPGWSCDNPSHGDHFMAELFATPEDALRSVATGYPDDHIIQMRTEDDIKYALHAPGGLLDQVVEVRRDGDRWGVLAVTTCIGFGPASHSTPAPGR